MKLKYLDGTESDDQLFDQELSIQRRIIAMEMGLNPNDPDSWPISTIDKLLGLRRTQGVRRFHEELHAMLSPH